MRRLVTTVIVLGVLLAAPRRADAQPHASPPQAGTAGGVPHPDQQEDVTVTATRRRLDAPMPNHDADRAPWETGTAIHDTMTGADTSAFGNAYNLGSPMGSDERSNETGGSFVAPRHDGSP